MRIRTIKPEFFKHDGLSELDPIVRILFIGLWCMADRDGRLEDRPRRIKAEVLPYDDINIEKALSELAVGGFILRYDADGLKLIEIPNFDKHQRITGKEAETQSKYPAASTGKQLGNNGETTETTGREGKGKEWKGMDIERETSVSSQACELFEQPQKQPDQPKPRKRDLLFDALVSACGGDPHQITARAARAAGVALAEIRKACPGVAPEQFARRAEVYRRKYRDAALTPSALCAHWAECDAGYLAQRASAPTIEQPPLGWREKLESLYPGNLHNSENRPWETLDASIRKQISTA